MTMKPWFRFYNSTADNPKVQLLPDHLFKAWVNLLCLACRHNGALPDTKAIAFTLRCSEDDAKSRIDALVNARLIDDVEGVRRPHDWNDWQYESDNSTPRVRAHRQRKQDETHHVTVDETDQRERFSWRQGADG
jgi:hypothetical protein